MGGTKKFTTSSLVSLVSSAKELIDLTSESSAKQMFMEESLTKFWCGTMKCYPGISSLALKFLLPFATTYLCESGFSTLVNIKTQKQSKLNIEDDMRLALSKTQPRIMNLASAMQCHSSH